MATSDELVVYTVAMGDFSHLPTASRYDGVRYICFTDIPELTSDAWEIRRVQPAFLTDLPRSSREPKILAHRFLGDEFSRSLYIDTRVHLTQDPRSIWNQLTKSGEASLGLIRHSVHQSLREEFAAVLGLQFDSEESINSQFLENSRRDPNFLDAEVLWGGMIARSHNVPEVIAAMELWWRQVSRFSRRDQLSLPVAARVVGDRLHVSRVDNHTSDFHRWPVGDFSRPAGYTSELDADAVSALELASRLQSRIKENDEALAELQGELQAALDATVQLEKTFSWRITSGLRWFRRFF